MYSPSMGVTKRGRREIRYIALSWLCSWIRGVEPLFFDELLSSRCRLQLSDACGFLQLGSLIRYGEAGTEDCIEECAYLLITADRGYSCGSCTINPSSSPVQGSEPSPFDIFLDLDVPVEDRALIRRASDRWSNIIRSELVDVAAVELVGTTLLDGNCRYPSLIDDIYICFQYIDIDGAGGVVARTTILATRPVDGDDGNNGLPISARIRLDNADVDSLISDGLYQDVIEHEIAHALGFGILWGEKNLTAVAADKTCSYTGPKAAAEFRAVSGGCTTIPNSCGHWDEECAGRELMTPTLDFTNALSRITIASMEDLGYDVDYSFADTFGQIEVSRSCIANCRRRNLLEVPPPNSSHKGTTDVHNDLIYPTDDDANVAETKQQKQLRQQRRKLSDDGYAYVLEHGRDVLAQERSQSSMDSNNRTIYILYMEENELYSVPVLPT